MIATRMPQSSAEVTDVRHRKRRGSSRAVTPANGILRTHTGFKLALQDTPSLVSGFNATANICW